MALLPFSLYRQFVEQEPHQHETPYFETADARLLGLASASNTADLHGQIVEGIWTIINGPT